MRSIHLLGIGDGTALTSQEDLLKSFAAANKIVYRHIPNRTRLLFSDGLDEANDIHHTYKLGQARFEALPRPIVAIMNSDVALDLSAANVRVLLQPSWKKPCFIFRAG